MSTAVARASVRRRSRVGRLDPARVSGMKFRLVRQFNRRFLDIKRAIATSIVQNDCFGIQANAGQGTSGLIAMRANVHLDVTHAVPKEAFRFETSAAKIARFMDWLRAQEEAGVLDIVLRPGMGASSVPSWSGVYLRSFYVKSLREAYEQGIRSGRSALQSTGIAPMGSAVPGTSVQMLMQQPIHVERVGLIYSRTYEDLKTVMEMTNAEVRRKVTDGLTSGLARGMAEGKSPIQIARELVKDVNNRVDAIGLNRARLIARTEVARAHHKAIMAEYRQAGAEGVSIQAEFTTSGADNVCEQCEDLEGNIYTIEEAEDLIPVHPSCGCFAAPLVMAEAA